MASIKSLNFIAIVLALAIVTVNSSSIDTEELKVNQVKAEQNNLIVGELKTNDLLDYQENISVQPSWFSRRLILEKTFYATEGYTISQVRALDQATDGNGGYAVITAGGPGEKSVTLRFRNHWCHSIDFVVQLYAGSK
ncbi:probable salivary secreted peptide [Phymastichus coffea]|uniref:probable salivary secreted peptide n=1 Tax=Phymastichus coffea TaxID=108790 RepID=UPI00273C68EB|nr:probable salivary secreted peptide [Phymastichus coffea]